MGTHHDTREHDPWVDRLSEYVDGELTPAERATLETHLSTCTACAEALEGLRAVVSRAHALEDAPPAEDLWPGIATQIAMGRDVAPERREPLAATRRMWWARRVELGVPQLAAAGVLLIAISAGAVWLVARGPVSAPAIRGDATPRRGTIAAAPTTPTGGPASDATAAAVPASDPGMRTAAAPGISTGYDASIAALEQALAEGGGQLDPKTLRTIERNLRIIDRALSEARQAVAADPNNTWLQSHLAATMKRKADLLRTATLLTAAQG